MRINIDSGYTKRALTVNRLRKMGASLSQAVYSVVIHNTRVRDLTALERVVGRFTGQDGKHGVFSFAGVSFCVFGLSDGVFIGLANEPIDKAVFSRLKDVARNEKNI